jgi:four helix bundle protein
MQDFRNLQVWQKAHSLVLSAYAKTATFPKHEIFGLTSQVRRAAVSTAANIAEGSSRRGDKEFARFLEIAAASATELEYFSILVSDLGLLNTSEAEALGHDAVEVRRMIAGLIASLPLAARSSQLAARSS